MKKVKLGGGHSADIPENDHSRHRRKAYFHGKYNREVMATVLLVVLWMCVYRIGI